ncbi:carotenoid ester lipase precursor [Earliella scabrosa]|nr:carotenoid ester lipase precursor [Earliella scabrosa]
MLANLGIFVQLALVTSLQLSAHAASVKLDNATVIGTTNDSVTTYWGIHYAHPPVGDLRLRLPQPIGSYSGTINATLPGVKCVQLSPPVRPDLPLELLKEMLGYAGSIATGGIDPPESEDCLTINVQVPEGTNPGDKLPVIAIIYGGGFVGGHAYQMAADALIRRSVELNQPVAVVAMNYRLGVFSQLGGKEIKEAGVGNLALQDQREALRWVHKHIAAFGGDPERVTLWGVSAGGISISLQTLTNGGNPAGLFHGAVMHAGSPIPTGDITLLQPYYDQFVEQAGCAGEQDTLQCLRSVSVEKMVAAGRTLPNLFDYAGLASIWSPHADGVFLKAPPQHLVLAGSVAKIPIMTGDVLDEGTAFAVGAFNVTTEDEFRGYVAQNFYPRTPLALLAPVFSLYPADPAQGSPFGTGDAYQLTPMYKRLAAFLGDFVWQAPRRFFLNLRAGKQDAWSFVHERGRVGSLGYPHGVDFAQALTPGNEFTDYLIQFAATKDPNGGRSDRTVAWPKYDARGRKTLRIVEDGLQIGRDTDRLAATEALTGLSVVFPM